MEQLKDHLVTCKHNWIIIMKLACLLSRQNSAIWLPAWLCDVLLTGTGRSKT